MFFLLLAIFHYNGSRLVVKNFIFQFRISITSLTLSLTCLHYKHDTCDINNFNYILFNLNVYIEIQNKTKKYQLLFKSVDYH